MQASEMLLSRASTLLWSKHLSPLHLGLLASCRGPQTFGQQGPVLWKMIFPWTGGWAGAGGGIIQVHYIYYALSFF